MRNWYIAPRYHGLLSEGLYDTNALQLRVNFRERYAVDRSEMAASVCDTNILQAAEIEPDFSDLRLFSMRWGVLERVTGIPALKL